MYLRAGILFAFAVFITQVLGQSYRGLSVVDDQCVWISGSKGTVVRTTDGAMHWDTVSPEGFQNRDFRDIHAWDNKEAIVMSAGDSAVLLYTSDGGKKWKQILCDYTPGVFWDAIDVSERRIIMVGDESKFEHPYTSGKIYYSNRKFRMRLISSKVRYEPPFQNYQTSSFFAASGSNVFLLEKNEFCFIPVRQNTSYFNKGEIELNRKNNFSLHKNSITYMHHFEVPLPFPTLQTFGAYSMAISNTSKGCCVGGSYLFPDNSDSVSCYTIDSGRHWNLSETMPKGYRSCVTFFSGSDLGFCTGTNGSDYTIDGGINWKYYSNNGYNVCAFSKNFLWLAGGKGRWEKIKISEIFKRE